MRAKWGNKINKWKVKQLTKIYNNVLPKNDLGLGPPKMQEQDPDC